MDFTSPLLWADKSAGMRWLSEDLAHRSGLRVDYVGDDGVLRLGDVQVGVAFGPGEEGVEAAVGPLDGDALRRRRLQLAGDHGQDAVVRRGAGHRGALHQRKRRAIFG